MEISQSTLDNGLRVVHNHDTSTAMVAVDVLYDVGARDESPRRTGMAHLLEHLMFGGSANVDDFDGHLQRAGGTSNAWTSNDFTNFYDVLPSHNIATAFWLESDRMISPKLTDQSIIVQKSVVIEEFKQQCLNKPYGDSGHILRSNVYHVHPYRYPVIGKDFSHIQQASRDEVSDFFLSHYAPNNAVLSVSGNVTFEHTLELAKRWFGDIAPRDIAPRLYPQEPRQTASRSAEASGNVPFTEITLAYRMDGYGTEQYYCADLLTDLFANGSSSRFYRRLALGTDIFAHIDASITGSEEPGILMIQARLNRSADTDRAIALINGEIADIINNPPSSSELTRAVNRMQSATMFANLNYLAKAQVMATAVIHRQHPDRILDQYRLITPEMISAAAAQILDCNSLTTLVYHPDK